MQNTLVTYSTINNVFSNLIFAEYTDKGNTLGVNTSDKR